ncbi:MAG: LysM peptidoglycan-binding domain-containing protein [Paracoccaceae bacterium]
MANGSETYQVQPGDTLSALARASGTTVSDIARANGIADPDKIQAGQTLVMPGAAVPPAAAKGAQAGENSAITKADAPPGTPDCNCNEIQGKIRAGGDDNADVIYAEGAAKAGLNSAGGYLEGQIGAGMVRMDHSGLFGESDTGGSHHMELMTGSAEGYVGVGFGAGGRGKAEAYMIKHGGSVFYGSPENPLGEVGSEYQFMSAEAKGDFLLGSDGKRAGVALGGYAGAHVAKADLQGEVNIPIPWTDWTVSARAKGGIGAGADIGANAHAYKNLETERYHAGLGGAFGPGFDLDLSVGPKYEDRKRPDGP